MSISDKQKLELIWKSLFHNVSQTDQEGKDYFNEVIPTYTPVLQEHIWTKSHVIPKPQPTIPYDPTSTDPKPDWFDAITVHVDASAVTLKKDLTSRNGKAWVAVSDMNAPIDDANRLGDWVSPKYHPSYRIKVYTGSTNSPVIVRNMVDSEEWQFDYASGVLYFYNDIPAQVLANGLWIEGTRYIGAKGGGAPGSGSGGGGGGLDLSEGSIDYTTKVLQPNASVDFDLDTGGSLLMTSLAVNARCVVECHSTSLRNDTNPYKFIAMPGQFVDDGSFVVAGQRYFGPRYCRLQNLEDLTSTLTYWRITNSGPSSTNVSLSVKYLRYNA